MTKRDTDEQRGKRDVKREREREREREKRERESEYIIHQMKRDGTEEDTDLRHISFAPGKNEITQCLHSVQCTQILHTYTFYHPWTVIVCEKDRSS